VPAPADAHDEADLELRRLAKWHLDLAILCERLGDDELAALQRRRALVQLDAADIERESAALHRRRG
jgi:hypothetical protein